MASSINDRFGTNLRKTRLGKGISQERLADLAGLHRTYISSVERGERNVTLQTVEKLARALGVSMARLMPD
jgi:transcriptional regulator with XRE-family HTH domain